MTKITKDIIIETAYQLFFKHGYNNVTINDICKECKITKPTFYTYIKSKDDILAHFMMTLQKQSLLIRLI